MLQMHFLRARTIDEPVHRHLDHLEARMIDPRHTAFIQPYVTDNLGCRHAYTLPRAVGRNKAAFGSRRDQRAALLRSTGVVGPVPLSTTPVPLRNPRARHE